MSTVRTYRKKPVEVRAIEFRGWDDNGHVVLFWLRTGGAREAGRRGRDLIIPTLEGDMTARPGDFIIQGVEGEFYPCKPGIFRQTYKELYD